MFFKDNLCLIRVWRGFSQHGFAVENGFSQAEISKYENGSMNPDSEKLALLAQALDVSASLFAEPDLVFNTGVSFYRKQSKLPLKDLKRIEAEALVKRFHVKSLATQIIEVDFDESDPVLLAQALRSRWQVSSGPIPNLCHLLESNGIIICESSFKTEMLDGFFIGGDIPMVFVNELLLADRFLFTIAHELGHLLMHTVWSHKNEDEANAFAAELLMPVKDISNDFKDQKVSMERLAELKPKWNVSMQALLYRAGALGFLTDSQKRRLWTEMGKLGYRKREPVSLDLKKQKPTLLKSLIMAELKNSSIEVLAEKLHTSISDLRQFYSFEDSEAPVKKQKPVYSGNLTGGALLLKESRIVAELLCDGEKEFDVRREIIDDNLFQNGSPATTRKYLNLIFQRFSYLTSPQLRFVSTGDQELATMTLFYAVLKSNRLIIDFLYEVLADKIQRMGRAISRQEWLIFLDEKCTVDDAISEWSEKSKAKVGQVVFRILFDAGYLTDTKDPEIVCPLIPHELEESLLKNGEGKYLSLMELRAKI